jgi:hypothetical protein
MWVRDRLDWLWRDDDFQTWYPRDGSPGLSPAQLATVGVLQFLLDLSDRGAAGAVRCRIDFKYALGLDLTIPAFITACWAASGTGCWRRGGRIGSLTWPWPG